MIIYTGYTEHQINQKKEWVQNLCKIKQHNKWLFISFVLISSSVRSHWKLTFCEWLVPCRISNRCQKHNKFQSFLFEVLTYLFVFGQSTQFKPRSDYTTSPLDQEKPTRWNNFPSLFSARHSAQPLTKPYDLSLSEPKFAKLRNNIYLYTCIDGKLLIDFVFSLSDDSNFRGGKTWRSHDNSQK